MARCAMRGAGLLPRDRHRDGPLIVLHEEHARRTEHGGQVEGLVRVALGRRAVTHEGDGDRVLAESLGGHRRADGVQAVRADRNR